MEGDRARDEDLALGGAGGVREQAHLVSCGVRLLALLNLGVDPDQVEREYYRIHACIVDVPNVIPFVLPVEGSAVSGIATHRWVIELLQWAYDQPVRQAHQIRGLLLGYSPAAIAEHDGRHCVGLPKQMAR